MSARLSVDKTLMKARSHFKKNEIIEPQELYQTVLLAFPKNIRAQQGLAILKRYQQKFLTDSLKQSLSENIFSSTSANTKGLL